MALNIRIEQAARYLVAGALISSVALADNAKTLATSFDAKVQQRLTEVKNLNAANHSWNTQQEQRIVLLTGILGELAKNSRVMDADGQLVAAQIKPLIAKKIEKLAELSGMEDKSELESLASFRTLLETLRDRDGEFDQVRAPVGKLLEVVSLLEAKYGLNGQKATAAQADVDAYRNPRQGQPTLGRDGKPTFTRRSKVDTTELEALAKSTAEAKKAAELCTTPEYVKNHSLILTRRDAELTKKMNAILADLKQVASKRTQDVNAENAEASDRRAKFDKAKSEFDRFKASSSYEEIKLNSMKVQSLLDAALDFQPKSEGFSLTKPGSNEKPADNFRAKQALIAEISHSLLAQEVLERTSTLKLTKARSADSFARSLKTYLVSDDRRAGFSTEVETSSGDFTRTLLGPQTTTTFKVSLKSPDALAQLGELLNDRHFAELLTDSSKLDAAYDRASLGNEVTQRALPGKINEINAKAAAQEQSLKKDQSNLETLKAKLKTERDELNKCGTTYSWAEHALHAAGTAGLKNPTTAKGHVDAATSHLNAAQRDTVEHSRRYPIAAPKAGSK